MSGAAQVSTGPAGPPDWLLALREETPRHPEGSLGLIDAAALARGLRAATGARSIAIGRAMPVGGSGTNWSVEHWIDRHGPITSAHDRLHIVCHGTEITHLDALNHFGLAGTFYSATDDDPARGIAVLDLIARPIVTRGILLDLTEDRPGGYVEPHHPVTARDLQSALYRAGVTLESGDGLLLYMGRDRYEAAGHVFRPAAESPDGRPGVGPDGARWLATQPISLLGWDFLDAHPAQGIALPVHALSWAIGLVLVDNCDLSQLSLALHSRSERAGLLAVCPLPIGDTTGCAVNPVVIV